MKTNSQRAKQPQYLAKQVDDLVQRQRKKPVEKTGRAAVVREKILGKTFGRLTVTSQTGKLGGNITARCSCGNEWRGSRHRLLRGAVRSCGCLQLDIVSLLTRTHGHTSGGQTKVYHAWRNMRSRCYLFDPTNRVYRQKGIQACDRWVVGENGKNGFECFADDVGPPPSEHHTIERVDNAGNYTPDNVVWASRKQQARNRDTTMFVEFKNERRTIPEWAELIGLKSKTLLCRLRVYGWTVERALTTPCR